MTNPLLTYLLQKWQLPETEMPKPRRHKIRRSWLGLKSDTAVRIERQLQRARVTYGRTQRPHDLERVQRLERALLSVNGVKE